MIRFIERIITRFRKPKPLPGSKHWTPAEMACFDDMIEGFETLNRLDGVIGEQSVTVASGRTVKYRPVAPAVMPAIVHDESKFKVGVPLGLFHLDGSWEPNHHLIMSPEDQRKHNEDIGALSKGMREFNEEHGTSYVSNPSRLGVWHAK